MCQNYPDGYQAVAFEPRKLPRWRSPPYLNILIPEHHITPHMIKVNVMAKLNTVPDSALREIEEYINIWTVKWKTEEKWKNLTLENFLTFKALKVKKWFLTLNVVFQEIVIFTTNVIFFFKCSYFKFQEFLWICVIFCMLEFWLSGEMGQHAHHI